MLFPHSHFTREKKRIVKEVMEFFESSIKALQMLNKVGYGILDKNLPLDLVYNPSGAFLPGDQSVLEVDFKKALLEDFNIKFNQLFTITNLPISRFLDYLITSENYEEYMYTLVDAFNPSAVKKSDVHQYSFGQLGRLFV